MPQKRRSRYRLSRPSVFADRVTPARLASRPPGGGRGGVWLGLRMPVHPGSWSAPHRGSDGGRLLELLFAARLPALHEAPGLFLLLVGQLDAGSASPAVGQPQPKPDRHRRAAFGTSARQNAAVEPNLARRSRGRGGAAVRLQFRARLVLSPGHEFIKRGRTIVLRVASQSLPPEVLPPPLGGCLRTSFRASGRAFR